MRAAAALLAAVVAVRLVVAAGTGLVEDEAYYWAWSRRLAAGYYDHPPAIAWLVALGDRVFGATSLGVRLGPVLAGGVAIATLLPHARRPLRFVALVAAMPLFTLGGILATPDVPLLLGWAVALAGALDRRWWLAGLGAGLAGLGKYTGWGFWPLALVAVPRDAVRMLPGVALTVLCLIPNLLWNAAHDWVSVRFQLHHGLASAGGGVLAFVGAQVGLVSPLLFVAVLRAWRRGWSTERTLVVLSLAPVAFFTLAAARGAGEANWAAVGWLGAALLLARVDGLDRLVGLGVGLGGLLSALVLLHLYVPIVALPRDPTARLGLGATLARSVEAWGIPTVYTTRYQEAALLAYHAGLDAHALPGVDRADQYDLWPTPWVDHALFVRPWKSGATLAVEPFCDRTGAANDVTERGPAGEVLQRWQVVEVWGCHPR